MTRQSCSNGKHPSPLILSGCLVADFENELCRF